MKILFITIAFAPTEFSESIVNSKLVLALKDAGHEVEVISRGTKGPSYSDAWNEPWLPLRECTYQVDYEVGNKFERQIDLLKCGLRFQYPLDGVRWASRAYDLAMKLHKKKRYDVVMTRSPADISHIIGLKLQKNTSMKWITNWNDPANDIWPPPYAAKLSKIKLAISHYYTKKILQKADLITFPSARLREHFLRFYDFDKSKSSIIPHISLEPRAGVFKSNGNSSILTICHAGNLSTERDPEILFKGMARIKNETGESNINFTVIGEINSDISDLVSKYDLHNEVRFEKGKPFLKTQEMLALFDVLCVLEARMSEGIFLPSKISDYCILRKPILSISPKNGAIKDLINENGGGLVGDNEDEESIYNSLKEMVLLKMNNQLQGSFSSDALRRYHSPSAIVELYNSLFSSLSSRT